MIEKIFFEHPKSVGETYGQHFSNALSFAMAMFAGSLACLIHAIIPAAFKKTGSSIISKLHGSMVVHRTTDITAHDDR